MAYEATPEEITNLLVSVRRYSHPLKQFFIVPIELESVRRNSTVLSAKQKDELPAIAEAYLKSLNNP